MFKIKWNKRPTCGSCEYYKKGFSGFKTKGFCTNKNVVRDVTGQDVSGCPRFKPNKKSIKKLLINDYGKRNSQVLD